MQLEGIEKLSPVAREALAIDPESACSALVNARPSGRADAILSRVAPRNVLTAPTAVSESDAACLLAGLWLWHDQLDRSHQISQTVQTPSGSYWHAIMHRREGDFWNSKYWLNRCAGHPALARIGRLAADAVNARRHADSRLMKLTLGEWNPAAFVDLVEAVHDRPDDPIIPAVVELQKLEWRGLFEHCLSAAAG